MRGKEGFGGVRMMMKMDSGSTVGFREFRRKKKSRGWTTPDFGLIGISGIGRKIQILKIK